MVKTARPAAGREIREKLANLLLRVTSGVGNTHPPPTTTILSANIITLKNKFTARLTNGIIFIIIIILYWRGTERAGAPPRRKPEWSPVVAGGCRAGRGRRAVRFPPGVIGGKTLSYNNNRRAANAYRPTTSVIFLRQSGRPSD